MKDNKRYLKEDIERTKRKLRILLKKGIINDSCDINELKKYLNKTEYSILKSFLNCKKEIKSNNENEIYEDKYYDFSIDDLKVYNENDKLPFADISEMILNPTPYDYLKIEKTEYTKDELNCVIVKRINEITERKISEEEKQYKIDTILDAYNSLIKQRKL